MGSGSGTTPIIIVRPDSFWLKLSLFPLPSGAVKRNHDQKIFDFTLIVFHEYLFVSSIKKIVKLKLLYSN